MKKFIKILEEKNIMYQIQYYTIVVDKANSNVDLRSLTTLPENVKFENQGNVDLRSLTTLPENVKFENQGNVDLRSLTTLPENVKFENQGYVDLRSLTTLPENVKFENQSNVHLRSLTTLPENVKFENQSNVHLRSLTTLPENVKFENQGYVDLESLTTLPENVKFENQGYVYLESLNDKTITYQGKNISIKQIDGYTMIISSSKQKEDFIIHKAMYFKGGDFKNLPKCIIAQRGEYFSHGENAKDAINDVNFKFLQNNLDVSQLVMEIKERQIVTINDYRLLTGACSFGVKNFMRDHGISDDELPLSQVLTLTQNAYGGGRMQELFA